MRLQLSTRSNVKYDQGVKRQRDGEVVDQGEPNVSILQTIIADFAQFELGEDDFNHGCDWLDYHELKCSLLYPLIKKCICLQRLHAIERPWLRDSSFEIKVLQEGCGSADVGNEQLYERVEHVRLVKVPDRGKVQLMLGIRD